MEAIRRFFYNLMVDENKNPLVWPVKFVLWVLSLVYGLVLWIRDIAYRMGIVKVHVFSEVKVISVGNLTVGGTGKTPMVMRLATLLKERGREVAVLLRGYGQDEYVILKNALKDIPVIKGKDRVESAKEAIDKYKIDTLILDDGFQYRRLKKDFNILLINSRMPFGNGHLLPRGILREAISNAKNADVIVLTKTADDSSGCDAVKERINRVSKNIEIFKTRHKPLHFYDIQNNKEFPLAFLREKKIASLSSIGDPQYFNCLLKDLGAKIILKFPFLDHHNYRQKELDRIIGLCKENNLDTIVITEKDASKLTTGFFMDGNVRFLSLKINMDFREDETHFVDRLLRMYTT